MKQFPWDTQICSLNFGNLVHEEAQVNISLLLQWVDTSFFVENKEFELKSKSASRIVVQFNNGASVANTPTAVFTFELRRKATYYVLNILIPTVVLSVLSLIVFCIPIDAGEKMSLGITVLLSFSVYMLILSENTPETSENVPILCKYRFQFSISIVFQESFVFAVVLMLLRWLVETIIFQFPNL